jgi:hypothetical protein
LERKVHWLASNASTVIRWATCPATAGSRAGRDDMKERVARRREIETMKKRKKKMMVATDELVVHIVETLSPTRLGVPLGINRDGSLPPEPI